MIVVLAGRRIDAEDAEQIRFPLINVQVVYERVEQMLTKLNCQYLICSGACGADLIALSVADKLGINRRMILPFRIKEFRSLSVVDRPGEWGNIFDQICEKLNNQHCLDVLNLDPNNSATYGVTNKRIIEKAVDLTRTSLDQSASALVVWEGEGYGPEDTTNLFRQQAIRQGLNVHEVITL